MASSLFRCRVQTLTMLTIYVLLAGVVMSFLGCIRGGYPRARYPQFTYTWHPSHEELFTLRGLDSSYDSKPGIVPIYLKFEDGQILYLPEITPKVADDVLIGAGWKKKTISCLGSA